MHVNFVGALHAKYYVNICTCICVGGSLYVNRYVSRRVRHLFLNVCEYM